MADIDPTSAAAADAADYDPNFVIKLFAAAALRGELPGTAVNAPGLTDVSDRAARVLGHVEVDNFPATQAISHANLANLDIALSALRDALRGVDSKTLSDIVTALGALTVSVSNFPATQPVSGSVSVSNFPATQPVSGTVSLSGTSQVDVTDESTRLLGKETTATDLMRRCLKFEPVVGEEIRRDETTTDDYHGIAPDGTLTSATSWSVVRFYKDVLGNVTRVRYRSGVAWDSRTAGW